MNKNDKVTQVTRAENSKQDFYRRIKLDKCLQNNYDVIQNNSNKNLTNKTEEKKEDEDVKERYKRDKIKSEFIRGKINSTYAEDKER